MLTDDVRSTQIRVKFVSWKVRRFGLRPKLPTINPLINSVGLVCVHCLLRLGWMGNPWKKLQVVSHFRARLVRLQTRESHPCFTRLAALLLNDCSNCAFAIPQLSINIKKIRHSVYLVRSFDFCCLHTHRSHGTLPINKETFKFRMKNK